MQKPDTPKTASPDPVAEASNATLIIIKWIQAFNAQRIDELLALYADDAVHKSPNLARVQPETGGIIQGKKAMKEWWEKCWQDFPNLQYKLTQVSLREDGVFLQYLKLGGLEEKLVGEIFKIREGLIVASEVLPD